MTTQYQLTLELYELQTLIDCIDPDPKRLSLVLDGLAGILRKVHPRLEDVEITRDGDVFLHVRGEQNMFTDIAAACVHNKLSQLLEEAFV